jgi:AraC-like DNA-binding protein
VDFRCRARVEPAGKEEPNPTHSIVFVRRGVFVRTDRDGTNVADANQILFFNEGQPYRYAHPVPGGDDCTILTLDEECARAAVQRFVRPGPRDPDGPFPVNHALLTPRAAQLHHELLAVSSEPCDASGFAAEDIVADLIDESLSALHGATGTRTRRPRSRGARQRDAVEAVKLILSRSIGAPPSLAELAAAVGCSPFHLSHIFRTHTGLALRHYVRRLRALLAADRLRRGARDLTSLALDLGFYDHSHFTNVFRQEWGVPPSRIRPTSRTARGARNRTS